MMEPHPAVQKIAERRGVPLVLVRRLSDGRVKYRPKDVVEAKMLPSRFWELAEPGPVKVRFRKGAKKAAAAAGLDDDALHQMADAEGWVTVEDIERYLIAQDGEETEPDIEPVEAP